MQPILGGQTFDFRELFHTFSTSKSATDGHNFSFGRYGCLEIVFSFFKLLIFLVFPTLRAFFIDRAHAGSPQ